MTAARGTSNGNARGNTADRAARRAWLVDTWRADVDVVPRHEVGHFVDELVPVPLGSYQPACRCYRCGALLTVDTVTVDRIIPGCKGGTYRRNNIRPACARCNSETGGKLARRKLAAVR